MLDTLVLKVSLTGLQVDTESQLFLMLVLLICQIGEICGYRFCPQMTELK